MMSTKHISQECLFNYVMNETPLEQCPDIESHLERCADCRLQKQKLMQWIDVIQDEAIFQPDEENLIRARNRLAHALESRIRRKPKLNIQRLFTKIPKHIETRQLAWAAVIFLGGICIGRYFWPMTPIAQKQNILATLRSMPPGDYQIVPSSANPDQVEIRIRSIQDQTFEADVKNPDIQTALAYALLNESTDNERFRTMDLIQFVSQNETVENALMETLANDPNPGLRYRAIKLLKQFPINEKMKNLLIQVLFRESNPGVRIQVTEKLIQSKDPDILPILKNRAEKDEYIQFVLDAADTKEALSVSHE